MARRIVEAWCASQQVRGLSERSIKRRRWAVDAWLEHTRGDLATATGLDVEMWLTRWTDPATRRAALSDLRQLYRWAVARELLDRDPTERVELPRMRRRQPTPVSADNIRRLVNGSTGPVHRMVMLAAYAGLRVAEVADLRGEDIELRLEVIVVRNGKGGKDRIVPLAPELLAELADVTPGRLFDGLTPNAVSQRIARLMRRLEVPGRPHDLRAAFGTEVAVRSGGNLVLVAQLLGHESITTSQHYVRWVPEGADVVRRLYGRVPAA